MYIMDYIVDVISNIVHDFENIDDADIFREATKDRIERMIGFIQSGEVEIE